MTQDATSAPQSILQLLQGVKTFSTTVFHENKELFAGLASSQSPHTLFITCADSRVSPEMITQSEPGDLFVLRNIGNIVPGYGEMLGGVSSAIEYAVSALGVKQIIICGHSDCGAMKALLDPGKYKVETMPTVASWLRNAQTARAVAEAVGPNEPNERVQHATEQNVLLQLAHLRTHPAVAAKLATGKLVVQGWFYHIPTGTITVFDENTQEAMPLDKAIARFQERVAETV
ncbi:carbonic anhydrase [Endobacter medicaginis]|jgi:carbonic anhydrase|uniref:Carbonic anhydrase n=1 Tax=Endobacter medicaginis TaxID=1181271 RepID=A0A839UZI5_9PROT|nr:carbonic anhydrase [Endobacter medicaginis]MBB3175196.1 carbonic anhydrase [Endobacter medicaginis]MCX5476781.1 carbonic anhydrase [Endobacter medicaginis]NVN30223.1 carbonic anhydrase [Endobacter medicaginis]